MAMEAKMGWAGVNEFLATVIDLFGLYCAMIV